MKKTIVFAILGTILSVSTTWAKNTCVRTRDIESSDSKDGKTLVFKMRGGSTLVNHLRGVCPGLKYDGFIWVIRGGNDEVCENQQSLQVLRSGEICMLGSFDQPTTKPKK